MARLAVLLILSAARRPIFILIHYISRPMNRSAIDRAAAILFALLSATLIAAFFLPTAVFSIGHSHGIITP